MIHYTNEYATASLANLLIGFFLVLGLLNVVQNGLPSDQNPYVINGDFVDRGKNGTEICLILFGFRKLMPASSVPCRA